jgi:hypothetical protein
VEGSGRRRSRSSAAAAIRGAGSSNRLRGVIYSYFAKKPEADDDRISTGGAVARSEKLEAKVGMNWLSDLRYPGAKLLEGVVLWGGDADGPGRPGAFR